MQRVLLVSNAAAGEVSTRKKEVIAKALSADFKLEVADTAARNHASELSRAAVADGYDAVLAFGGDGTINEVAQGVVGTDVPLGILPGGSTNVMARILGMPTDAVEATAFVAARLRSNTTRRINVGRLQDRYFLFSAGMGLDAEVVRRVEARPESKRKWGEWLFLKNALVAGVTRYRGADPDIRLEVEGFEPKDVVFALCGNARPFTYFGRWMVDACPHASLDDGLDVLGLMRVRTITVARILWSVFVSRSHVSWRIARYHHDIRACRLAARRPLPVQVDGDYLGEATEASIALVPAALDLLV